MQYLANQSEQLGGKSSHIAKQKNRTRQAAARIIQPAAQVAGIRIQQANKTAGGKI